MLQPSAWPDTRYLVGSYSKFCANAAPGIRSLFFNMLEKFQLLLPIFGTIEMLNNQANIG